ncbi:SGNH/GDSL hydrolase family protein [Granulicella sp. L46]|uniref:SGNH/GDSL hydrolase family protein n=1 Tax=Granulicella sp. L46 TaxID=1641865 RepID=UPI00131AA079|nr:SGNH/GDSL hydrolase family protein [Granulicella sp. L46]
MSRLLPLLLLIVPLVARPQQSAHVEQTPETVGPVSEEIEWTWEVRPAHVDPKLPNVLLVGDSITRNYYPDVEKKLSLAANVYLLASSTSLGDPRLSKQLAEFWSMEGVRFHVIHLSNGLHGWSYTESQYGEALPLFLTEVRSLAPDAHLIWTSSTAVRDDNATGATNARIDARNQIASTFFKKHGISIDDQHRLMLDHRDDYQDSVHFNEAGSAIQAEQAVATIQKLLTKIRVSSLPVARAPNGWQVR